MKVLTTFLKVRCSGIATGKLINILEFIKKKVV